MGCLENPSSQDTSPTKQNSLILVLLIVTTISVISIPALDIGLWGDDFWNLEEAYELNERPARAFERSFVFFRPTMLTSMYVSYRSFGTEPFLYNLATLCHHLLVVVLLIFFMKSLHRKTGEIVAVAILFGTTPLASEATLWSGARADVLLATIALVILLVLGRSASATQPRTQLMLFALFLGGMCTKESWVVLPLAVFAFLVLIKRETVKRAVLGSLSGWILLCLYTLFFFVLPQFTNTQSALDYGSASVDPGHIVSKFGRLFCHYFSIGQAFGTVISRAACGLVAFALVFAVALWKRNRFSLFGGVFLALALTPTIHFEVAPSRFNYLALIGFFILVIPLFEKIGCNKIWRIVGLVSIGIIVAFQVRLLLLEHTDYRKYGDRHSTLVEAYTEIAPSLKNSSAVLVINLGTIDGPIEFRDSAIGLPKGIYPKPGELWNLIGFKELADFCGSPFDRRMIEIADIDIDLLTIESAVPLVFDDSGFTRCPRCTPEVLGYFGQNGHLPPRARMFHFVPVG